MHDIIRYLALARACMSYKCSGRAASTIVTVENLWRVTEQEESLMTAISRVDAGVRQNICHTTPPLPPSLVMLEWSELRDRYIEITDITHLKK